MKVSHEVPKTLFEKSRVFNDYPYVLGHLIKQDSEYREFYKKELKRSDFSILDNSAFELGASIPFEELISVARELKPSHLILPDTVHDQETTLKDSIDFYSQFRDELRELGITPIGVVQGNSFRELYQCILTYTSASIYYIAIPFDCIKDSDYSIIRFQFFKYLLGKLGKTILSELEIHFLGIQNPQELLLYTEEEKRFITSIDTSSPILHGIIGSRFTQYGSNQPKPKLKLADNLDISITEESEEIINYNINFFKQYTINEWVY